MENTCLKSTPARKWSVGLLLSAWTLAGLCPAQERTVGRREPPPASQPVRAYPALHALCIGINDYASPDIPDLSYAENDAVEMAQALRELYGFDNVRVLLGREATKANINVALADLFDPGKINADDGVVIYFSGHGQTVRQGGAEAGYLIPQDAQISLKNVQNPQPYRRDALRMDDLQKDAEGIPARHVLFIVDACYSGFLASKSLNMAPEIASALQYKARQVITAGTAGEEAVEHNDWRHGAFTFKLLEILKNEQEPLSASKLGVLLKERVPREVQAKFGDRRRLSPQAKYLSGEGDFIFARPGARLENASNPALRPRESGPGARPGPEREHSGPPPARPPAAPPRVTGLEHWSKKRMPLLSERIAGGKLLSSYCDVLLEAAPDGAWRGKQFQTEKVIGTLTVEAADAGARLRFSEMRALGDLKGFELPLGPGRAISEFNELAWGGVPAAAKVHHAKLPDRDVYLLELPADTHLLTYDRIEKGGSAREWEVPKVQDGRRPFYPYVVGPRGLSLNVADLCDQRDMRLSGLVAIDDKLKGQQRRDLRLRVFIKKDGQNEVWQQTLTLTTPHTVLSVNLPRGTRQLHLDSDGKNMNTVWSGLTLSPAP